MQHNHDNFLYPYKTKLVGMVVAGISLGMLIFHYAITPIILVASKDASVNGNYFHLVLIVALYVIMNSREKIEDERIVFIRGKALIVAYRCIMILILPGFLASTLVDGVSSIPTSSFSTKILVYASFISYFTSFYMSFYFDKDLTSSNYTSFQYELRKKGYIHWFYILLGIGFLTYHFFTK